MIRGDDWVLVENPKTASSSMQQVLRGLGAKVVSHKHATLMDECIGERAGACRLKFVVVRNPFDRMVSAYYHDRTGNKNDVTSTFEKWLLGGAWEAGVGLDIKRVPQTCWAWGCNVVLRYEDLGREWPRMLTAIGLPYTPLTRKNATHRPAGYNYRDEYTDRTRQIVEDRFGADLIRWGYEF